MRNLYGPFLLLCTLILAFNTGLFSPSKKLPLLDDDPETILQAAAQPNKPNDNNTTTNNNSQTNNKTTTENNQNQTWPEEYQAIAEEMAEKYGLTNLSPADKERYFPDVQGNPTAKDWANFMQKMSLLESGHRPNLTFHESFTNQYGETVISTGLTQISYASANGYRDANGNHFNVTTKDLMNPKTNLEITAAILATNIAKDGVISGGSNGNWQGAARYWAIFRTGKM